MQRRRLECTTSHSSEWLPLARGGGGGWRGHGSEDRIQEIVAFVPDPEQGIEIESRGLIDNDSALETPE